MVTACYELNVCVLIIPTIGRSDSSVMVSGGRASGRCLGHEGGAIMNRISALTKEIPESSLVSSFCHMRLQLEDGYL